MTFNGAGFQLMDMTFSQQLDYNAFECQELVLAPTRELAQQIEKVMKALGDYLGVKVHACVGGTSVYFQSRKGIRL